MPSPSAPSDSGGLRATTCTDWGPLGPQLTREESEMARNNDEKKAALTAEERPAETGTDVLLQANEDAAKVIKLQGEHLELANAEIKKLLKQVEELKKGEKFYETKIEALEKKIKAAKSAPTGDVVYMDGRTWVIKGTVRASMALDHVKKGYLDEDVSLIITDRRE